MAYDEYMADRIRYALQRLGAVYEERKMFGGLCFMVDEKMCVGIFRNALMARIDPGMHEQATRQEGVRPMDSSGKSMKGFVYVEPAAIDLDSQLEEWVRLALEYNPTARATSRK
jgi:TfoX/Sxy family transcriptional regulator of competence genes